MHCIVPITMIALLCAYTIHILLTSAHPFLSGIHHTNEEKKKNLKNSRPLLIVGPLLRQK
jgi:hypothetical protein